MSPPDLHGSPWRGLVLSERRDIWCLVDADDWDWIAQWRWNWGWHAKTKWKYYAKRNVGPARSTLYLARELMIRDDPRDDNYRSFHVVDHINRQSLDNRRANRRWATMSQNNANRGTRADVPSLEAIVADLLAEWNATRQAQPQLEEMPF